jgi:hypothetical protein
MPIKKENNALKTRKIARKTRHKRQSHDNLHKEGNETTPLHYPITEQHNSYASSMIYDGNHLIVDTKINDQPTEHKIYTMRDLRKHNALGAELVTKYLRRRIPRSLRRPIVTPHIHIQPVLPDLGLNDNNIYQHNYVTDYPNEYNNNNNGVQLEIIDNNRNLSPINELPITSKKMTKKFRQKKH